MSQSTTKKLTMWEKFQQSVFASKIGRFVMYAFMIFWSATTIVPLLWVMNNSFKMSNDVINNSFSLALNPTLYNYQNAFDMINIGRAYFNSIVMAFGAVFFVILLGGFVAYAIARFDFKLRAFIQTLLVLSLLIPPFATVIPVYEIYIALDLLNTHLALIIYHTAGFLPFCIIVVSGYMATIPKELEESALMDGASRWTIYTKIFVPLSKPSFATTSVFVFLWSYNDLFSSLIFVNQQSIRPVVVLLSFVSTQYGTDYGLMATAVTLTAIPVIIVYLFIQQYIEKGITAGAVKG